MLNDRFNNNSKFDLKEKFRDKKFVSAVGIGIFVLILFIVLIASCNKKKPQQPGKPAAPAANAAAPAPVPVPDYNNGEGPRQRDEVAEKNAETRKQLMQEGFDYKNGDNGKKKDYAKAKECFVKAKELGAQDADVYIRKCDEKLKGRKQRTRR